MAKLKTGDHAPDFSAKNQHGEIISLSSHRGKKLILYFYPKDNTPGCTAEACNFRDNLEYWKKRGFEIIGISPDNEKSHKGFDARYQLGFQILSDPDAEILKAYGAWGEKKMYGKVYEGVLRSTFVISEEGKIIDIVDKVDTKNHTAQIITQLKLK